MRENCSSGQTELERLKHAAVRHFCIVSYSSPSDSKLSCLKAKIESFTLAIQIVKNIKSASSKKCGVGRVRL
jgi:hypothetical protein